MVVPLKHEEVRANEAVFIVIEAETHEALVAVAAGVANEAVWLYTLLSKTAEDEI